MGYLVNLSGKLGKRMTLYTAMSIFFLSLAASYTAYYTGWNTGFKIGKQRGWVNGYSAAKQVKPTYSRDEVFDYEKQS
jgi:hypothetical protein